MIEVLILDDHLMVRKGLEMLLEEADGIVVKSSFGTAKQLKLFLNKNKADVLLLDINLPDANGIELCVELKKDYSNLKILAISNFDDTPFIKNMMRSGASGYLLKNTTESELIQAIKSVYQENTYLPDKLKDQLLYDSIGQHNRQSFIPRLTRREKEVLQAIANEKTNTEIAKTLFISIKTVEGHRNNLLQKFEVRNTAGLIKEAIKKGLIDP